MLLVRATRAAPPRSRSRPAPSAPQPCSKRAAALLVARSRVRAAACAQPRARSHFASFVRAAAQPRPRRSLAPSAQLPCPLECAQQRARSLVYREQFSTSNLVLVQDSLYWSCTYLVFQPKNKLSCTSTCLLYREQFSTSNLVPVQAILYFQEVQDKYKVVHVTENKYKIISTSGTRSKPSPKSIKNVA